MDATDAPTASNNTALASSDGEVAVDVENQRVEDAAVSEVAQKAAIVQQRLQELCVEDAVGPSVEEGDETQALPDPVSHADLVPEFIDVEAVRAEHGLDDVAPVDAGAAGVGERSAAEGDRGSEFASVALAAVAANHLVGGGPAGVAASDAGANEPEPDAQQAEWTQPPMEDLSSSSDEGEEKPPPGPAPIAIPWKQRSNQVFVLTNAGKSIYSRYGDENEMLGKMGVIQAIISRCECDTEERIRHITAGDRSFVFLLKEPMCVRR